MAARPLALFPVQAVPAYPVSGQQMQAILHIPV
jgi:hypothetical protein